jgi:hypothetical protein
MVLISKKFCLITRELSEGHLMLAYKHQLMATPLDSTQERWFRCNRHQRWTIPPVSLRLLCQLCQHPRWTTLAKVGNLIMYPLSPRSMSLIAILHMVQFLWSLKIHQIIKTILMEMKRNNGQFTEMSLVNLEYYSKHPHLHLTLTRPHMNSILPKQIPTEIKRK